MYQIEASSIAIKNKAIDPEIPRVVFWVGMTSLLTDISSEMISSVLPIFLYSVLHLSPLQVGFYDGLYSGGAAFVRVIAGYWADRTQNYRLVAFTGYALSTLARLVLVISSFFFGGFVLMALVFDRIGKGIRTAPRDAIIAGHTQTASLAAAMGLHRRLDAVGAFIGPLIAAGMLWWLPMEFKTLFSISLSFAILGLVVFWFRVTEPPHALQETQTSKPKLAICVDSSEKRVMLSVGEALKLVFSNSAFLGLVFITMLLNIFTISDGLIYLSLQRQFSLEGHWIPIMHVATALVFVMSALHIGRLADQCGAVNVFLAGHATLALAYVWFAFGLGNFDFFGAVGLTLQLAVLVILLGLHYAATDGILAVLAIGCLPVQVRTTGLALITTAIGVTKIGSSTLYGWIWQTYDAHLAAKVFAIAAIICWVVISIFLYTRRSVGR